MDRLNGRDPGGLRHFYTPAMSRPRRLVPASVITILATVTVALAGRAPLPASAATVGTTPGFGVARYVTVIDHRQSPPFMVDFSYPQLVGDAPARGAINRQLKSFAASSVAAFEQQVREQGAPPPSLPPGVNTATLTSVVTTDVLTRRLVGFTFAAYVFPAGAAHGVTAVTTFTFDAATGERIALSTLFRPGSPWLDVLSADSRSRLPAVLGSMDLPSMLDPGTAPKASNFSAWSISPFGLQLTFGDYQVAPYAAGTPSILIPFAALRYVLAAKGAAALAVTRGAIRMPLLPARTAPVTAECDETVSYPSNAGPTPLFCAGGKLNVAAWQSFTAAGTTVLAVGAHARLLGVHRAMCADDGRLDSPAYVVAAAKLAASYYGWPFAATLATGFPTLCRGLP